VDLGPAPELVSPERLDFHDVAVWSIRNSLAEAYAAGQTSAKRSKKRR